MQKLFIALIAILAVSTTKAQTELTFKPFKVDISAGYALPTTGLTGTNGGFLLSVEPKYAVSDHLTFGIKAETAISISRTAVTGDNIHGVGSYQATADYYFNTNKVRPFAGIGVGFYTHASTYVNSTDEIESKTNFGGTPRVGIEVAHFRAAIEYNFAGKVGYSDKSYVGIKLGVLIGGGRVDY
jgi:hypothetical protein